MKETNEHNGLLLLFDAIGLLLTTVALTLALSAMNKTLDMNVIILSVFFLGVKVLMMGIADIIGIGKKILVGILFILFSDVIIILINILMAFGISNKGLLLSAGSDLLIVILIRVIRKAAFSEKGKKSQESMSYENQSTSGLLDNEAEQEKQQWISSGLNEHSDMLGVQAEMEMASLQKNQSVMNEEPVVQVGTEKLMPVSEEHSGYLEFFEHQDSAEEKLDDKFEDGLIGLEFPENERPSDAPNLDALDAFFSESGNQSSIMDDIAEEKEDYADADKSDIDYLFKDEIKDKMVVPDTPENVDVFSEFEPKNETDSIAEEKADAEETAVSPEIDELTQEMNRQFEVLQNRVDDLEQREAELKRREEEFRQSSTVYVRPKEVHLNNEESEIIINKDDLELLKAYLKQHPEI